MKHSIYYILIALGLACALSCTKEDLGPNKDANVLGVSFRPMLAASTVATRAASDGGYAEEAITAGVLADAAGEKSFPILCTVGDIDAPAPASAPAAADTVATKGTLLNDSGAACDLSSKVTTFHVTAWDTKTGSEFIPNKTQVDYTDEKGWSYPDLSSLMWTYNDEKLFLAYANEENSGASFTFPPYSNTQTMTYEVNSDASKHKDILLGYYKGIGEKNDDGENVAPLEFFHPLSAVSFKMGYIGGVQTIKSIVISGVYSKGYCSQNYDNPFTWHDREFTRENSYTLNVTTTGTDGTLGGDDGHFMFIPQEFSKENPITIKVTVKKDDGSDDTFYGKIESGKWEAGKHYVYTLGDNLPIFSIADDATIKNESAFAAYVRAAVVGNWYDNETLNIVEPWKYDVESVSGWTKRSDGFWYYDTPVQSGASTTSLMPSFAKPTKDGETFKYRILVQGSSVAF